MTFDLIGVKFDPQLPINIVFCFSEDEPWPHLDKGNTAV